LFFIFTGIVFWVNRKTGLPKTATKTPIPTVKPPKKKILRCSLCSIEGKVKYELYSIVKSYWYCCW
jgi:hypothetical protein